MSSDWPYIWLCEILTKLIFNQEAGIVPLEFRALEIVVMIDMIFSSV